MSNEKKESASHYNVYSKLAAGTTYTAFGAAQTESKAPGAAGALPRALGKVTINGGAGVANSRSLETPKGVLTVVTAEELETLNSCPVFLLHKKNRLIFVEAAAGSGRVDVEEKVEKLLGNDNTDKASPLTPEKPAKTPGGAKPATGTKSQQE